MSSFGDLFTKHEITRLKEHLGDSATYTSVDQGTTSTVTVISNEFVGAIDEKSRAIFTIASADVTNPRRGDSFVLNSETWYIMDVRADEAGTFELRCDRSLEDN